MRLFKKKKTLDLVALANKLIAEHQQMTNGLDFVASFGNFYERRKYHLTESEAASQLVHFKEFAQSLVAQVVVMQAVIENRGLRKECDAAYAAIMQQVQRSINNRKEQQLEDQRKAALREQAKKDLEGAVMSEMSPKKDNLSKEDVGQVARMPSPS